MFPKVSIPGIPHRSPKAYITLNSYEFSVHFHFHSSRRSPNLVHYHFMESLHAKCLFANIISDEDFKICINELLSEMDTIQNLDRNYLEELLTLTTYE